MMPEPTSAAAGSRTDPVGDDAPRLCTRATARSIRCWPVSRRDEASSTCLPPLGPSHPHRYPVRFEKCPGVLDAVKTRMGSTSMRRSLLWVRAVLANLQALRIDTAIPTFTDVGFDNVRLGDVIPVPEPGTTTLFVTGVIAIALFVFLRSRIPSR